MWKWLTKLFGKHGRKKNTSAFGFRVGPARNKRKNMPLEIELTNEQEVPVSLKPVTATGRAAKLDGAPTWDIISGNSTITVAADGLSAVIRSSDDPGDTELLVKADADLGSGVEEISDTVRVHVLGARASNLGLSAGTPGPKA